jgi:hypothetical protein
MAHYKNEEIEEARRDFEQVFKMDFAPYHMKPMSVWAKHVCIDVHAFRDALRRLYGYEDGSGEIDNILLENYGEEGVKLFRKLL